MPGGALNDLRAIHHQSVQMRMPFQDGNRLAAPLSRPCRSHAESGSSQNPGRNCLRSMLPHGPWPGQTGRQRPGAGPYSRTALRHGCAGTESAFTHAPFQWLAPWPAHLVGMVQQDDGPHTIRVIVTQRGGQTIIGKHAGRDLLKHPDCRQHPQQPVQRVGLRQDQGEEISSAVRCRSPRRVATSSLAATYKARDCQKADPICISRNGGGVTLSGRRCNQPANFIMPANRRTAARFLCKDIMRPPVADRRTAGGRRQTGGH